MDKLTEIAVRTAVECCQDFAKALGISVDSMIDMIKARMIDDRPSPDAFKILDCPFCGSDGAAVIMIAATDGTPNKTFVMCRSCDATGPMIFSSNTKGAQSPKAIEGFAIVHWNTRVK